MTIKQQGGVFGRNPTFNNVEIDGTGTVDGDLTVNGFSYFNDRLTVTDDHVRVKRSANTSYVNIGVDATSAYLQSTYSSGGTSDLRFLRNSSEIMRITGNGITFNGDTAAANALDDYEEGTWTPVFTASTTDPTFASYPVRSAHYRKIGAMVFITARFRTSGYNIDGVGNLRISGLPYAAKSSGSFFDTGGIIIHSVQNWGSIPSNGVVKPGDAFISLIGSTGFVDQSVLALGTGTNNNDISFSGMYVTD